MMHFIGHTRNGAAVRVDLVHSNAAKNISRQPRLLTLASEALREITAKKSGQIIEHNMGRTIGYDFVVDATSALTIFYAKPIKDTVYTRFIKHAKPSSSSCLTIHLTRDGKSNDYLLNDVWIGQSTPPRPGDTDETNASKDYWANHALVFDNQPIQSQSITKDCPY